MTIRADMRWNEEVKAQKALDQQNEFERLCAEVFATEAGLDLLASLEISAHEFRFDLSAGAESMALYAAKLEGRKEVIGIIKQALANGYHKDQPKTEMQYNVR